MAAPQVPWITNGEAAAGLGAATDVVNRPLKSVITKSGIDVDNTGFTGFMPVACIKSFGAVCDTTTDDTVAIQEAIYTARRYQLMILFVGRPRVTAPLDFTFSSTDSALTKQPFTVRFSGSPGLGPASDLSSACLIADHNGIVLDCSGSYDSNWENPNVAVAAGKAPLTCWLFARNSTGQSGGRHVLRNPKAYGSFVNGIVYSYGAEEMEYENPRFYNVQAGGELFVITQNNIRNLSSTFHTIATGLRSNLVHHVRGGSLVPLNAGGKAFYLEGVTGLVVDSPWMFGASGAADGHSLFYVDTSIASSDSIQIKNILGEVGTYLPQYAIYASGGARTLFHWSVEDCYFPTRTRAIYGADSITFDRWRISGIREQSSLGMDVYNLTDPTLIGPRTNINVRNNLSGDILFNESARITALNRLKGIWFDPELGVVNPTTGVKFQATQNASADPNTLDDYREIDIAALALAFSTSGSVTVNAPFTATTYTKVGRQVTVIANIQLSAIAAPTGNVTVTGLPFASRNVAGQITPALVVGDTLAAGITAPLSGYLPANSTTLSLFKAVAGGLTRLQGADLTAGSSFYIVITYTV